MNRIDRLVAILTTLQSRKFVTAEFIADKYEISERTVYRDLKAHREIRVPWTVSKMQALVKGKMKEMGLPISLFTNMFTKKNP